MAATPPSRRRRSWWGWGWEDQALTEDEIAELAAFLNRRFGVEPDLRPKPALRNSMLPVPRIAPPDPLRPIADVSVHERARHTYGRAFRDVARALAGDLGGAPDAVVYPASIADVARVLEWCDRARVAVVAYGGGSSVVGGVEYRGEGGFDAWVSLDLTRLDRVVEIDTTSRAALVEGGIMGPTLEGRLRPSGLTFRHFPQSFEFSTLGGWIATRSGGHYATALTHVDDLVEGVTVVTPAGELRTLRVPGSGAGPSPDRLFLGSEGALGIITEAWIRLQARPVFKTAAGVHFARWEDGVAACRALAQSGLQPANCRLIDAVEAVTFAGVRDGASLLVLGFESADHPVDAAMERALELCRDHGGVVPQAPSTGGERDDAVGRWRSSFFRAPYLRDALIRLGVIVETFETACTWQAFDELHAQVTDAAARALQEVCGIGWVTCRFTHLYPDGPAPYFSVFGMGRRGSEVAMWDEIKAAVSEAVLSAGGTITHHHAVGRDHRPWYDRQVPELVRSGIAAAKAVLDPGGILNPGVLVDPR